MKNSRDVISFCESMCNLLNSGYSLQSSVQIISTMKSLNCNVRNGAKEIYRGLEKGNCFSSSLSENKFLKFKSKYISIFSTVENTGKISETFNLVLNLLKESKETNSRLLQMLVYPIFVIMLCLIISFFVFFNKEKISLLFSFSGNIFNLNEILFYSIFRANAFLFFVFICFIVLWNKITRFGVMKTLFTILEYMASEKQDILIAFELCRNNFTDFKFKKKLTECIKNINEGKSLSESFSVFGNEISSYLEYSEYTANVSDSIILAKKMLENQHKNKSELFIRTLEPASMATIAIYLVLLFGNFFLYFMRFSVEYSFL